MQVQKYISYPYHIYRFIVLYLIKIHSFFTLLLFGILSGHNSTINYELERMINKIIYMQHFVCIFLFVSVKLKSDAVNVI